MKRILFVCHGNICRSPMAEIIFRDLVEKRGCTNRYFVASCATSSEEIFGGVGNPVYPAAREVLARHGLSTGEKRAVLLRRSDYEKYDLLLGMDEKNVRNMLRILGGDPLGKVGRLLPYDVEDPWYTGAFDTVYRQICEGCTALLERLEAK